jgi:predicted RNase H-like HicB family nuclease
LHSEALVKKRDEAVPTVIFHGQNYRRAGNTLDMSHKVKDMKIVKFQVSESEGYFVADAVKYSIVTQAKTWNKLMQRIDEAVRLYFKLKSEEKYKLELDVNPRALSLVRKSAKA